MDILYFTTRPKNREKMIQSASTKPLVAEYETNRKAEERHPEKQEFVICDIVEHDANVKSYFLKKKDGTNPAFFRAGQYVVVRQKSTENSSRVRFQFHAARTSLWTANTSLP